MSKLAKSQITAKMIAHPTKSSHAVASIFSALIFTGKFQLPISPLIFRNPALTPASTSALGTPPKNSHSPLLAGFFTNPG